MFITNLYLNNFRNFYNCEIVLSKGYNFITGNNGSGKTNILESIYVLSNLKSFRNVKDDDLVSFNQSNYYIKASTSDSSLFYELGYSNDLKKEKRYKISGESVVNFSNYYGKIVSVVFSPTDISLIDGPVENLRKYIDSVISKYSNEYLLCILGYKKSLLSRNCILKRKKEINDFSYCSNIEVWDDLIIDYIKKIVIFRDHFINEFCKYLKENYNFIIGYDSDIVIKYNSKLKGLDSEEIKKIFYKEIKRDIFQGFTGIGVHRDKYDFEINKYQFDKIASQGQKRICSIALKNSERMIVEEKKNVKSIILIDDIFSELDSEKQEKMINIFENDDQKIFTMTSLNNSIKSKIEGNNIFKIHNGKVI